MMGVIGWPAGVPTSRIVTAHCSHDCELPLIERGVVHTFLAP